MLFIGLTSILVLTTIDSHMRDKLPHISCIKAIDIYILVCLFFVFLSLLEYVYINYLFFSQVPRRNHRRCRKPRRVVARYRYQEVVVANVQVWHFEWQSSCSQHLLSLGLAFDPFAFHSRFYPHQAYPHSSIDNNYLISWNKKSQNLISLDLRSKFAPFYRLPQ